VEKPTSDTVKGNLSRFWLHPKMVAQVIKVRNCSRESLRIKYRCCLSVHKARNAPAGCPKVFRSFCMQMAAHGSRTVSLFALLEILPLGEGNRMVRRSISWSIQLLLHGRLKQPEMVGRSGSNDVCVLSSLDGNDRRLCRTWVLQVEAKSPSVREPLEGTIGAER
jgi:hypothetical protein